MYLKNILKIINNYFQVYELKLRGYSFSILDNAFLSHRGFQTTKNYPNYRKVQIQVIEFVIN